MFKLSHCQFCEAALGGGYKTRLFLRDEILRIVAVEDLHSRKWAKRILLIPFEHIPESDAGISIRERMDLVINHIGVAIKKQGYQIAHVQWDNHSDKSHYHVQLCLTAL